MKLEGMKEHVLIGLLSTSILIVLAGGIEAQSSERPSEVSGVRMNPKEFGFGDRITVISATSFFPAHRYYNDFFYLSPSFGRYIPFYIVVPEAYYAALDVPAGAIIDSIGLNNTTDQDGVLTASIMERDRYANVETLGSVTSTVHGWNTDYSAPLTVPVPDHVDKELVLKVEQAASTNFSASQYFAWVEVQWHRTLSPAPESPSFNDVPTNHPFFQFIEALKASGITGGCGDGTNYCPDASLTRGQMAVFLAKALGLHWPN